MLTAHVLPPLETASAAQPSAAPVDDLHDLLTVITQICDSLANDLGERPEHHQLARVGVRAADRAAALVETLRAARPAPQMEVEAAPAPASAPRVLIVEDDPSLLQLLTQAFLREGFQTFSANNGRRGLDMLRTLQPDLMITDIVMPEMEGIGTIMQGKRCAPNTRVIAISGGGQYGRSKSFLDWASELGADEVLAKPFRVSSLILAARLVLDRPAQHALGA